MPLQIYLTRFLKIVHTILPSTTGFSIVPMLTKTFHSDELTAGQRYKSLSSISLNGSNLTKNIANAKDSIDALVFLFHVHWELPWSQLRSKEDSGAFPRLYWNIIGEPSLDLDRH